MNNIVLLIVEYFCVWRLIAFFRHRSLYVVLVYRSSVKGFLTLLTFQFIFSNICFLCLNILRRPWVWNHARNRVLLPIFFLKSRRWRQFNGLKSKFNIYIWWFLPGIANIFGATKLVHSLKVKNTYFSLSASGLTCIATQYNWPTTNMKP